MDSYITECIHIAVQAFRAAPDADEDSITDELVKRGIDRVEAQELVVWVPFAFSRVLLAQTGLRLPDTYLRAFAHGIPPTRCLIDHEPVFSKAIPVAYEYRQAGLTKDEWLRIAARSAELDAVNQALNAASQIEDLVLREPIVVLADRAPWTSVNSRPWWRFW